MSDPSTIKRLIVAITGASGTIYGIRTLELLRLLSFETHLILSSTARLIIMKETTHQVADVESMATLVHDPLDFTAPIASGSYITQGMIIAPCSIKTLSAIANSYSADLISRAADVCLKEGRPLLLMVRETPLHKGHLELMRMCLEMGAILFPPVPAFYGHPKTIDDLVNATVGRALFRLGIQNDWYPQWEAEIEY